MIHPRTTATSTKARNDHRAYRKRSRAVCLVRKANATEITRANSTSASKWLNFIGFCRYSFFPMAIWYASSTQSRFSTPAVARKRVP